MPELINAVTAWAQDNVTVAALAVAAFALLWGKSRDFILDRLLAGAYRRITAPARHEAEIQKAANVQRERLRSALGVLSEGLAMDLAGEDSRVKIAQAMAVLRADPRLDLDRELTAITGAIYEDLNRRDYHMDILSRERLTRPIIEKVRPLL
ncbi:MAG: hypothetical protein ACRDF0_05210 [Candidatus Limnocylindria bacterium]